MVKKAALVFNNGGDELMITYMAKQYIQMFTVISAGLCYKVL